MGISLRVLVLLGALVVPAGVVTAAVPEKKPAPARTPARAGSAATPADIPKLEFEKYTLPNGLQVILHVDRKLPIVNVNQWFHVGSKNEKPGRTGFAHLFEHMMFQGSKNTGDYFVTAEQAGANLREGGVNGTTNNDRTNYFATVPSGNLERLLWLESDRLATLADALTKEKLDNQRDVVKNERRQSLENAPYGRAFKLITENLHPAGHPYSWAAIGSHEDLTAASLDDVKDFFRTYYTPNNLSLVIAGDFDPAEAKRLVEKYFGPIPAGPPIDRPTLWIPTLQGEKIVEATDRVPAGSDLYDVAFAADLRAGRRRARPRVPDLHRRAVGAPDEDSRLRQAGLLDRQRVPERRRNLRVLRSHRDGATGSLSRGHRKERDCGDRGASRRRGPPRRSSTARKRNTSSDS